MDWNFIVSIFWKCSLGVVLIAITVLIGYLCAAIGSVRNSLNSIQNTLNSTENLVNQEIGILINDVSQTVKTINKELPELMQNLNGVTASIQQISEDEVQPTLHNIQEVTQTLNQSIQQLETLVEKISTFSGQTIEQAEYFRNQVAVSLADIVGMWQGLKAGWDKLYRSYSSNGADQPEAQNEDIEQENDLEEIHAEASVEQSEAAVD